MHLITNVNVALDYENTMLMPCFSFHVNPSSVSTTVIDFRNATPQAIRFQCQTDRCCLYLQPPEFSYIPHLKRFQLTCAPMLISCPS